mmetsp:Transcript_59079/g.111381  ORF Transcript_59079/g.111381 Transcript_59079/m.111381 type:complete len:383 (-) Transcript_59079:23-1171(-)
MGNSWPSCTRPACKPNSCCGGQHPDNVEVQSTPTVPRKRWKPKHRTSITTLPVELLLDFGFDPFEREPNDMCNLYLQMLQYLGIQSDYGLESWTIRGFANEVGTRYLPNPYHNYYHGFSVTQFLFAMFFKSNCLYQLMSKSDILALFVAMLVHDIDHPGNNNAFEIATKSSISVRYSELSPLENHHAAIGLQIMENSDRDMFGTLPAHTLKEVRETYTHAILQTDMKQHFAMVDQLKAVKTRSPEYFNQEVMQDRRDLVGFLSHSVDIGNPLLPCFELSRTWAVRISQEFWNQYEKEIESGLPPTQMWADINTPTGFLRSQLGFINFIVAPLWCGVLDVLPEFDVASDLRKHLKDNTEVWNKLLEEEELKQQTEKGQAAAES